MVDCLLCGGSGHTLDECGRVQPTALMNFLRDFRTDEEEVPAEDWVVPTEKVVDPAELLAVAAGPAGPREEAPGWHPEAEVELEAEQLIWSARPEEMEPVGPAEPAHEARTPPPPEVPQPEPAPARPDPGPSRRWGLTAVAVAAALAVAVAASSLVLRQPGQSGYPSSWDPRIARLAQFVQSDREMGWKHPVTVRFVAPGRYAAKLVGAESAVAPDQAGPQLRVSILRSLTLASGNVKSAALDRNLIVQSSPAVYVAKDKTVYVGAQASALSGPTDAAVVGALTHALQDQYFDLGRIESSGTDGSGAALAEGDALRVEKDYIETLPQAERAGAEQGILAGDAEVRATMQAAGVPAAVVAGERFPYDFGLTLADWIYQRGGDQALDRALARPPRTDGEVIDPSTYQPGAALPTPALARVTGEVIEGPTGLGEVPLLEMLGDVVGYAPAWGAIQGWTNDSLEAYASGSRICTQLAVLEDSPADAARLYSVAGAWASSLHGASVALHGTTVGFTSCDPGASQSRAVPAADPYQTLALRAFWTGELVSAMGLPAPVGACAADQLMQQIGPAALQADEQAVVTDSSNSSAVVAAAERAALTCAAGGAAPTPAG